MAEILASRVQQVLNDLELRYKDAIEDVVNGLVHLLGKIEDLSTNAHSSDRVSDNMQRLRELAYDCEDLLEMWAVEMDAAYMCSKNEKKRGIRRLLKRYVLRQYDGMTIGNMRAIFHLAFLGERYMEWFHDVFPDDKGMEIVCSEVEEPRVATDRRNVPWPRQTYAHDGMAEYFVGMEDDLKQLVSLVTNDDHKNCVVSIWGVEGLGKTTLARKVYMHPDVMTHFNALAWVTLGQGFQFGNLLQHMLKQLGGVAVKNSTAEELKKEADEKKKKKKKSTEEFKKGADEKKRSVEEPKKEADEKKSAEEQKIGAEVEKKKTGTEEQKKSSEENMIDQLKEIQRKKRCFIVIDGISEMSQWTDICSAFLLTDQGTNTRILLTTRDETIARKGIPHQPMLLNEDKGWELLQKYVFRGKKAADLGIAPKLGKEMVKKCGYLPSALSSLGRALTKIPLSEWHMVIDDVTGYLQSEYSNERSDDILVPRYDDIPYHLKQCFLYLGIFKEDAGVDSEDLTLLWMAEGMVKQESGKEGTVMDTTENYLRELADRNMLQVQVDELSANGRFMRLYLHNHVRESSLSLGEKEDFRLKVVDFSDGKQPMFDPFALFGGTRRLVIHFNKPEIEYSSSWTEERLYARDDLRSLFFLNSDQEYVDLPVRIVPDFSEFKLLRVVHFVRCKFEGGKLPQGIEKLVNLRYFGILYCDLEKLPSSISNFRNLYVLNVRANDDSKITIPNALSQMVRLKHLRVPNNLDHEQSSKLKLDGLVDLETLVGFNADIHDLNSLYKLEKLRLLVTHAYNNASLISIIKFFKEKGASMQTNLFIEYRCNFTSPEGLSILEEVLMCPNLDSLTLSMVLIQKLPNCGMLASSDITQIKLIGCKLSEDPMGALGKFLSLRKLCLGYGAFVGRKMAIPYTGFPKLEYLEFHCLPNLEEWKVDVGAMPHLSALTVRRCPKLKGIPKELASNNKSSLNNLEIELPPTALAAHQEAQYHQMFHFVKSRTIRRLDPLSSCSKDSDH
ncbi:hypothetical protein C2S51_026859 [Perilla frutescens var. frutescens]|nr:hypothetical protein C2S51_026859 [Perilla frutescens var. frutescens]